MSVNNKDDNFYETAPLLWMFYLIKILFFCLFFVFFIKSCIFNENNGGRTRLENIPYIGQVCVQVDFPDVCAKDLYSKCIDFKNMKQCVDFYFEAALLKREKENYETMCSFFGDGWTDDKNWSGGLLSCYSYKYIEDNGQEIDLKNYEHVHEYIYKDGKWVAIGTIGLEI